MPEDIDIFRVLDYLRDTAEEYAAIKGNRVLLEQYRKTVKAQQMQVAEARGANSAVMQEREAYASQEYQDTCKALSEAVDQETRLACLRAAAEAKLEAWRTLQSNRRAEAKIL